jgi:hypothetical protein
MVYNSNAGIDPNVDSGPMSAVEAGREILLDDGREYKILSGYKAKQLYVKQDGEWASTMEFSVAEDATAAEEEILARVATDSKWHNRMTAVTVEQYQKTIAEGAE